MMARPIKNPYGVRRKKRNKASKAGKATVSQLTRSKSEKGLEKEAAASKKTGLLKKSGLLNKAELLKNIPAIWMKSPKEMRASLVNVREWSSQVRTTMSQMETTLDTLHNLLGMYDRWATSQSQKKVRGAGKDIEKQKVPLSLIKTFNNIDFRQIISVLNSPLVQAFMELNSETESEANESKEG